AALLEKDSLQPVERMRIPTDSHLGYESICTRISELVKTLCGKYDFSPGHIGMGTPGTLDPITNSIKNCNAVVLNGKPLKDDLEKLMGIEVRLSNDANCFA